MLVHKKYQQLNSVIVTDTAAIRMIVAYLNNFNIILLYKLCLISLFFYLFK